MMARKVTIKRKAPESDMKISERGKGSTFARAKDEEGMALGKRRRKSEVSEDCKKLSSQGRGSFGKGKKKITGKSANSTQSEGLCAQKETDQPVFGPEPKKKSKTEVDQPRKSRKGDGNKLLQLKPCFGERKRPSLATRIATHEDAVARRSS